jgi:hypothetical protein
MPLAQADAGWMIDSAEAPHTANAAAIRRKRSVVTVLDQPYDSPLFGTFWLKSVKTFARYEDIDRSNEASGPYLFNSPLYVRRTVYRSSRCVDGTRHPCLLVPD